MSRSDCERSSESGGGEQPALVKPPRALVSSNPLLWFRFFGPGAILASVTIGSGELVFPSRGGSLFGYRVLWVFLIFALMKWVFAYASMRHMVLSGAHPFARWKLLPGPPGWLPLFMVVVLTVCLPIWMCFLALILGNHTVWICERMFHAEAVFGGEIDAEVWATVWLLAALSLLWIGRYGFLERAQMAILVVMLLGVFCAVAYVDVDWLRVVQGTFVPTRLEYPAWAREIPDLQGRSIWLELMMYGAAVGGQSADYIGYVSFLREKRWGSSHLGPATPEQLAEVARQPDHPARLWVRAALIDSTVSLAMVVVISFAFVILGAVILQPQQLIPSNDNLVSYQAEFLVTLSPVLLPLYGIAVFFAFFGVLYGSPELSYRSVFEYMEITPRLRDRLNAAYVRLAYVTWGLVGGLAIVWLAYRFPGVFSKGGASTGVRLVDIITPAGIVTGVLMCGFYCLANSWADRRFLPRSLRISPALNVSSIFIGVAFLLMGVASMGQWQRQIENPWIAYAAVGSCLALSFVCSALLASGEKKSDRPAL